MNLQLSAQIMYTRKETGRNIGVAAEAGKLQVVEIEKLKGGNCNVTELSAKGSIEDAIEFLRTIK